jgi:hypothetical protein
MPQDNDANDTSAAEQRQAKRLKSEVAAGGVEGVQQQDDAVVDGATVHDVDGSNVHESPRSEDEVQSALLLGSSSSSDDEDAYREAETESDDDSDDSATVEAETESDDGAAVDVGSDTHQPHRFNFASAPPSEVADIMRCANQHCLICCYRTYKKRHDMA